MKQLHIIHHNRFPTLQSLLKTLSLVSWMGVLSGCWGLDIPGTSDGSSSATNAESDGPGMTATGSGMGDDGSGTSTGSGTDDGTSDGGVCGDGIVQAGEACDDGNDDNDDTCSNNCELSALCGDGNVDDGEECDDGMESPTCDGDCTVVQCGDGYPNSQAGEVCDDSNTDNDDGCSESCQLESCGDGVVQTGEACDTNGNDTQLCDADCSLPVCGDMHVNLAAGENCDDGGDTLTCDADCTLPQCGDGYVNQAAEETCDNDSSACSDMCTILCGDGINPDSCTHLWSKRFGGGGIQRTRSVAVDGDGNVVIIGWYDDMINLGGDDLVNEVTIGLFVAKYSSAGDHIWSQISSDEGQVRGYSVAVDGQGSVFITGQFNGTMNLGGGDLISQGDEDFFVVKYSSEGDHIWSQRFGDDQGQFGRSVAVDDEGNVVVMGTFWGTMNLGGEDLVSQGSIDLFVAKLSAAGDHIWSHRFGDDLPQSGMSVAVDGEGNMVATGRFEGTMNLGGNDLVSQGEYDLFVVKFSPEGDHIWSQRFGDESYQWDISVAVDGEGNVLVTGHFEGTMNLGGGDLVSQGDSDLFVAKFSPDGTHLWSQRFGDENHQSGNSVAVDGEGNVVVTGHYQGAMNLGGDDLVSSQGSTDFFVAKWSPAGDHFWSKRFGDETTEFGTGVAVDAQGDVLVTGSFEGVMNLGGDDLVCEGLYDVFLAKLSG